jgi:DNA-binding NarL/FixJ family response regulator
MSAERLRVLVADDHPMFRSGLRATIDSMEGVEVVGEAATGTQTVRAARELRPDLIVMDLHMPELDGIQATRRILDHNPTVAVLVLTMLEDHDSVFAAMQAGARGYLLKGADHDDITRAVRGVAHGEVIFGPAVAGQVLAFFSSARPAPPSPAFPELTDREREVLELLAGGHSNATIATRLFLSPKTIRNYVSGIFTKLHVASRAEAIIRARDQGLGGGTTSQG